MWLLREFGNAWRYVEFEPSTGQCKKVPFWRMTWRKKPHAAGWYSHLGSVDVALYVDGGTLRLRVGQLTMPLDTRTTAHLSKKNEENALHISHPDHPEIVVAYTRPHPWPALEDDPTVGVEPEHHDFGLFLYNVINDPDRQARIVDHIQEGSG